MQLWDIRRAGGRQRLAGLRRRDPGDVTGQGPADADDGRGAHRGPVRPRLGGGQQSRAFGARDEGLME